MKIVVSCGPSLKCDSANHWRDVDGEERYRRDWVGPVGDKIGSSVHPLTKVSPGWVSPKARAAQGGVTLGPEQGWARGDFCYLGGGGEAAARVTSRDFKSSVSHFSHEPLLIISAVDHVFRPGFWGLCELCRKYLFGWFTCHWWFLACTAATANKSATCLHYISPYGAAWSNPISLTWVISRLMPAEINVELRPALRRHLYG